MANFNAGQRFRVVLCSIHFLLIVPICLRDTSGLIAHGSTCLPTKSEKAFGTIERSSHLALGEMLPRLDPVRQAIATYTRLAGITTGYGFFAPNVPDNYKLVFELTYPDDHVDYELPPATSRGDGLRIATLLDNLGQTRYDPLRELIVKTIAYTIWRQHPEVTSIRAVFGFTMLPTPQQFKAGVRESYQFAYAYDFSFNAANDNR